MSGSRLHNPRFPRSSQYHPDWVVGSSSGGANGLWLAEWLAESLDLASGMRVLDLGCGRAMTSIFLHREFGPQAWATDLWFDPAENLQRIRDAGVADHVFPLRADARSLPFAAGFFDAIVSVDSYYYFGTDDMFLPEIVRLVKPGGVIAIAQAGLMREFDGEIPAAIAPWWAQDQPWCFHSADWWRWHWARTGIVDVEVADAMPDGWQHWLAWQREVAPDNAVEINALEADAGDHLGYIRVVARRRADAVLHEPIVSIPADYRPFPLLRHEK